jgi:2-methylisocitrate lyase-like PEP mutase family enzyme
MTTRTSELRRILRGEKPIMIPGATDCFVAKLIERAGFPVVYVTGAGVTNTLLGEPDIGLITLTELAERAGRIAQSLSVPVIADCDTGFGGVQNVKRTIREYERQGIAGLHIEDQVMPKRCGHFEGKAVVPIDEMLYRLQAALDARTDPDFLIIARTDARAVEGFDATLRRARAYRALGADALFIEAPQSIEELERIGAEFPDTILIANIVDGGKTPVLPADRLGKLGFKICLYPNVALYLGAYAIREGMRMLREQGTTAGLRDRMMTFAERQDVVGLTEADAYEAALIDRVRSLSVGTESA